MSRPIPSYRPARAAYEMRPCVAYLVACCASRDGSRMREGACEDDRHYALLALSHATDGRLKLPNSIDRIPLTLAVRTLDILRTVMLCHCILQVRGPVGGPRFVPTYCRTGNDRTDCCSRAYRSLQPPCVRPVFRCARR